MRRLVLAAVLAGAALCAPGVRAADAPIDWPTRPVRVIVPYATGGPSDVLVRLVAPRLAERLGQPVIVENRPGASGNIGTDFVAKSAPDGYTLVIGTNTTAANATLYRNMPFDILTAFAPITTLFRDGNILVVPASSPAKSVAELIALARAKPGTLTYASSGNGTSTHLAGVLLSQAAAVDVVHVPYKGIAAGITDVIGGQVSMMFTSIAIVSPQIRAGTLRALAVTRDRRLPGFPDLPTMSEAGYPGFELTNGWGGVWAPAGTSPAIIRRLHDEIVAILRTPEVRAAFESRSVDPGGDTPDEFQRAIRDDVAKLAIIVRASGATLD
jgi:tripartite-type tricarboxylate transporter receptor subunit TctC